MRKGEAKLEGEVLIAIQVDEEALEDGGFLEKLVYVQSWISAGKIIAGRSCSCWEEGSVNIYVEIKLTKSKLLVSEWMIEEEWCGGGRVQSDASAEVSSHGLVKEMGPIQVEMLKFKIYLQSHIC